MPVLRAARERAREWFDRVGLQSPARLALGAFGLVTLFFAGLLSLPQATQSGVRAPFIDALFTATSAVCVTGLVTVDTGSYWSGFGQGVILFAIKVGGLGIMTLASLLGLAVSRRIGLTQRILAAGEARATGLGDVRQLLRTIIIVSTATELSIAFVLFWRLLAHHEHLPTAIWHAIFYGISAFNNAGFVPDPNGIIPFASDPLFRAPIALGVFIGGLGFPVYLNLLRSWRHPREWSLHTKLTLVMVGLLSVISAGMLALFEWNNPATLGQYHHATKVWQTLFVSINQRSGGFSAIDHGSMHEHTWLLEDVLMFIGGGSGGTAGGIRVTTVAVLILAIWAEARGRRDIEAFGKRIGTEVLRLAVAVTVISLAFVILGSGIMLAQTTDVFLPYRPGTIGLRLDEVLFEVVSAYATCGLSTGITSHLPADAKLTLTILMFVGRLGSVTIAAALALNRQRRVIRYPSERPLIG
ncbi:TrkH family potassium uptake protein [Demequina pelophila]|uniref:TrkH family potassium uptake protein n=1 Tax=Demequina pelophila TaxID=1638984 RepID=UPI000781704D|nr:potassium transporter TrkG [Demequina pelophila]